MKPFSPPTGAWLLALVVAGCAGSPPAVDGGADAGVGAGQQAPPAAVVLLVVDTLRADMTSMTGHYRHTTPQLDKLAREGVVFTAAYAPSSWTVPSMASLHTGVYPASHGIVSGAIIGRFNQREVQQEVLPDSFVTLAESFHAAGYRTVGVAANRHLGEGLGFDQGFDAYYEDARFVDAKRLNAIARTYLEQGIGPRWERSFTAQPSFLWLHYFDPHAPYVPRLPWIRAFADDYTDYPWLYPADLAGPELSDEFPAPDADFRECALPLYEAEVAFWDDRFRRLAERLGVAREDILLVFTSDHGEEFSEHGGLGHAHSLYEELVRVPLVFYWPRGIPGGRTIDEPVSILDIYPTLLELAGLEPPPGLQGRSLAPLLRGEERAADPQRELLFELHRPRPELQAIRAGRFKLIRGTGAGGRVELYDLEDDPGEHRDLSRSRPDVVERLSARLDATFAGLPPAPLTERIDVVDPELRAQLEMLGYMEDGADAGEGADAVP